MQSLRQVNLTNLIENCKSDFFLHGMISDFNWRYAKIAAAISI